MLDGIAAYMDWMNNYIGNIYYTLVKFVNSINSFFTAILKIISTLWYGAVSLFTSVIDLVNQVFAGTLFGELMQGFNALSVFVGFGSVLFISTLLYVIIFRIGVAFVFKFLRLNIDYKKVTKR